jgi:hypothetical protein
VTGSVSLLLAVVGAASAQGAWCALAGLPPLGAEAVAEFGIAAERTPIVSGPPAAREWAGLLAALVDAVDVVAARPGTALAPGELSRLAARARAKGVTLVLDAAGQSAAGQSAAGWPGAEVSLTAAGPSWQRAEGPSGRLTGRRLTVTASGRGRFARPSTVSLWLPARGGGVSGGPAPARLSSVR